MKTIIAGGRNFYDYGFMCESVEPNLSRITEIVSGGAKGADSLGESFAQNNKIPVKKFPANWDLHGKYAGHVRNKQMADYADALIAFWDGESKGTKNMIDTMNKLKKPVHVYKYK